MAAEGLRTKGEAQPAWPEALMGTRGPSSGSLEDAAFSGSQLPTLCQLCAAEALP